MNVRTKFEVRIAFSIPEIIGCTQKVGQCLDTPTLPFLLKFSRAFVRMDPVKAVVEKFTTKLHVLHSYTQSISVNLLVNSTSTGL